MKARSLALVTIAASFVSVGALFACATNEDAPVPEPDAATSVIPTPDAGLDALDDADDADAAELDPCTPDALCQTGLFDPGLAGGPLAPSARIISIVGRSATDVWAVGAHGAVVHYDGASWSRSDPGTEETMSNMWLRDSGEIALSSLVSVYRRGLGDPDASAGGWSPVRPTGPSELARTRQLGSCWTSVSAEWLWCATVEAAPFSASDHLNGLWRLHVDPSTSKLAAVDNAVPLGTCDVLPCRYMQGIHGSSPDDLWAVGFTGAIVHITGAQGATPTVTAFDSHTLAGLNAVWAASQAEAWAVGSAGVIRHYTDQPPSWSVVADIPATESLRGVWGTSSADVWAVGDDAVVLHFDGTSWSRVHVAGLGARHPNLYSVWASSPGHVWIGGDGVLLSLGGEP